MLCHKESQRFVETNKGNANTNLVNKAKKNMCMKDVR